MSAIQQALFNSSKEKVGWIAQFTSTGRADFKAFGIAVDSSGSIYVCGGQSTLGFTFKLGSAGTFLASNYFINGLNTLWLYNITSRNDRILVTGGYTNGTSNLIFYSNLNYTTLAPAFRYSLTPLGTNAAGIAVLNDYDGNAKVMGVDSTGTYIANFDYSTGARQSSYRYINADAGNDYAGYTKGTSCVVDRFKNLYIAGTLIHATSYSTFVIRMNSTLTISWKKYLHSGSPTADEYCVSSAVDYVSSENSYIAISANAGSGIVKLDINGSITWQYFTTASSMYFPLVTWFSDSAIYIAGMYGGISKFDSTGTFLWNRNITLPSGFFISAMTADASYVYLAVSKAKLMHSGSYTGTGGNEVYIFKLPSSGEGVGTYTIGVNTFTYAEATVTWNIGYLTSTDAGGSYSTTSSASAVAPSYGTLGNETISLTDVYK